MYSVRIGADGSLPNLICHATQERSSMRSHVFAKRHSWHLRYCNGPDMVTDVHGSLRGPMSDKKIDQPDRNKKIPFSYQTQKRYPEAEPILDPTCGFEEVDRGEGMGVDDVKTYHRTEK